MGPGGSQVRRSGATMRDRRDDVARNGLAKQRRERTKTASWSEECWRVTQSEQMRQAEGAGIEWGPGEARGGQRASGPAKNGVLRCSERRAHNLLAAVGLRMHTVA